MNRMISRLSLPACVALASACADVASAPALHQLPASAFARHGDVSVVAVDYFRFLPPLVSSSASEAGAFDPDALPIVTLVAGNACTGLETARLTRDGEGAAGIRVDLEEELYSAVWHSRLADLAVAGSPDYRLCVHDGDVILGAIGIDIVPNAQALKTVAASDVGLVAGAPLLIKFRIDQAPVDPPPPPPPPPPTGLVMSVVSGDGQVALAGTTLPISPEVRVVDGNGNPVAGIEVTFSVATGDGSITGPVALTDADGRAAVGSWTLGPLFGPNTLMATANGLAPVVATAIGTMPMP